MADKIETRTVKDLSRLSVIYLRNSINNPQWTASLDDYIRGCDLVARLDRLVIPDDVLRKGDESTLTWGAAIHYPSLILSQDEYDIAVRALRLAFNNKSMPVNVESIALIRKFNLKG